MALQWAQYKYRQAYNEFSLYEHITSAKPRWAARPRPGMASPMVDYYTANYVEDIKILVDEYFLFYEGQGHIAGYRQGDLPKAEEVYRYVRIGKFILRDKAIELPKLYARVFPLERKVKGMNQLLKQNEFWARAVNVEGYSVAEMKQLIDQAINSYEKKDQFFFPVKPV